MFVLSRYIDLEAIIAVQDRNQKEQDINNALFNVVTAGRTYELMAHDEEEKHRYKIETFSRYSVNCRAVFSLSC